MPGRSPPGKRVGKPPNILILCDDSEKREEIGKILKGMLPNDRYAIYDIRWDQLAVGGWSEQTALLVLSGHIPLDIDSPSPSGTSLLLQFLGDGGRLLAWACDSAPFGPNNSVGTTNSSTNNNKHILEYGVGPSSSTKVTPRPLPLTRSLWPHNFPKIVETSDSEGYSRPLTASVYAKLRDASGVGAVLNLDGGALGGKAVLSQIEFEKCSDEEGALSLLSTLLNNLGLDCSRSKDPEYTFGYLLGDHKKVQDFLSAVPPTLKQSELTLEFTPRGGKGSQPSHTLFPIHTLECPTNFSTLDYYENLETKDLGRLIVYTDTLTSTTHVFGGPSIQHGLVVIARRQTRGRGRGQNVWLSPEGCAMFSLQLVISMDSALGRRLSLAQHLAALSVILAVPNHKEIDLRVKWPNDIYIGEQKVGGVLVDSRLEGKRAVVNMGIGVNVSNAYPTVCLNSALFPDFRPVNSGDVTKSKSTKETVKKNKAHWTTEKLVARTLTEIEKLIESLEKHEGLEDFLQLYEDNWIHHSSQNTLPPEENDVETDLSLVSVEISPGAFTLCRIAGIDEYGFLRVIDSNSGSMFSVRPDGNSFDIANRLIALKPD
ncbi:biotin--protein ligase [Folsomia candida]|uniref:biotin--protein ligase n=1 Tax=Folsomia candida TaxID=158441 RepID=UPI001604DBC9|nr:biotin--protein ligase [Folsomia candida]